MTALVKSGVNPRSYDELQSIATAFASSGMFKDVQKVSQAIVKVQAGLEIGLPPFASMSGIHIIQGKPTMGANLIATLIKNDPRYNYKVTEHTAQVCRIQFFEDGEPCGVSEFTAQDAKMAQTKNMNKFPKNMLFARAISNGAKWYTPGIFGGSPVYTPEELGVEVDEDGGVDWSQVPERVDPVEYNLKDDFEQHVSEGEFEEAPEPPKKKLSKDHKRMHAIGQELYAKKWNEYRKKLVKRYGVESSNDLTPEQAGEIANKMESHLEAVNAVKSVAEMMFGDEWREALESEYNVTFPLYSMAADKLHELAEKIKGASGKQPALVDAGTNGAGAFEN